MGVVGHIHKMFTGQGAVQGLQNAQAAYAAVKDTDGLGRLTGHGEVFGGACCKNPSAQAAITGCADAAVMRWVNPR